MAQAQVALSPEVLPETVLSYLVPPGKNAEEPSAIKGTAIPASGRLFSMLCGIYANAETDCTIPIRFVMGSDGAQDNRARRSLLGFIANPTLTHGRRLAESLRDVTTHKSGLGLLFLLVGRTEAGHKKAVLSRFPAEQGVLAETKRKKLEVAFVERVFMKNAGSYKAAFYQDDSLEAGFWSGYAIDKQINATQDQVAGYWIKSFLESDFKTTSKAGTKRLALALKQAVRRVSSPAAKQSIVAAVVLARSLQGQPISINQFIERFGLGEFAEAIRADLPNQGLADDTFEFDAGEFSEHLPRRTLRLNTGVTLSSDTDDFDRYVKREVLDPDTQLVKFTTTGQVVDQSFRDRR